MWRAFVPVTVAVCLAFLADALLFRTGSYATILEPESSTGTFEMAIHVEQDRSLEGKHNVLVLGDSRIAEGFSARLANEVEGEPRWHFSNLGVPGTTPRCWYYLVRALDPHASRYQAVLIPLSDYEDRDQWEDLANRISDFRFIINRVRLHDTGELVSSFTDYSIRANALMECLFKGLVYQQDFQNFLLNPRKRFKRVALYSAHAGESWEAYTGNPATLAGLQVDWRERKIIGRGTLAPSTLQTLQNDLFGPPPPQQGRTTQYRILWLGRIIRHYAGSNTRVVFFRMPQEPLARPETSTPGTHTFQAWAAQQPSVAFLDQGFFASLENPEWFADEAHLNSLGRKKFSPWLARETEAALR